MRFVRMLILVITAMAMRLTASIRIFQTLRPMGMVNTIAIMQMAVTMRNIRSLRLIL